MSERRYLIIFAKDQRIGTKQNGLMTSKMGSVRELVSEAQLAEINTRQIHFIIAVVGDFDELKMVTIDAPPILRKIMDFGDD